MCLIIAKPANTKIPSKEIFQHSFETNRHGAGYMFVNQNGRVETKKGFMIFNDFWNSFSSENFTDEDQFVCHFRIATAGSVKPENCHPFPLTKKNDLLKCLNVHCGVGMAHNGVMTKFSEDKENDLSDSAVFVRDVLSHPAIIQGLINGNTKIEKLIELSAGNTNKIALLTTRNELILLGGPWQKEDGVFYSNWGYKPWGTDWEKNNQPLSKNSRRFSEDRRDILPGLDDVQGKTYEICPKCNKHMYRYWDSLGWWCSMCQRYYRYNSAGILA